MFATLDEDGFAMEAAPVAQNPVFEGDNTRGLHRPNGDLTVETGVKQEVRPESPTKPQNDWRGIAADGPKSPTFTAFSLASCLSPTQSSLGQNSSLSRTTANRDIPDAGHFFHRTFTALVASNSRRTSSQIVQFQ